MVDSWRVMVVQSIEGWEIGVKKVQGYKTKAMMRCSACWSISKIRLLFMDGAKFCQVWIDWYDLVAG